MKHLLRAASGFDLKMPRTTDGNFPGSQLDSEMSPGDILGWKMPAQAIRNQEPLGRAVHLPLREQIK